ncbi:MAG: RNA recognition motif domain-containing protein [Candidatus Promineifilaceae bacterium]
MENKLYVGNLSYETTEDDLRDLFVQAGEVKSVTVVKDRDTGRSRGFGFVEMETPAEAQNAISMFNGSQMHDRALTVNIARPREERPSGAFDNRRSTSGGGRPRSGGGGSRRSW